MECSVPKYYFNIHDADGLHQKDKTGAEFSDDAAAHRYAKSIADGLRDDDGFAGFHVEVRDQANREVCKVRVTLLH
jgi:hypothetical protein